MNKFIDPNLISKENRDKIENMVNQCLPKTYPWQYLSDKAVYRIFNSNYQKQAIDFLIKSNTTCLISLLGKEVSPWGKTQVNKYNVTLENDRGTYTYVFFDSITNTEKIKSLRFDFYSVLACLDCYCPESFDDFCSDYGYQFNNESEYVKVKTVHLSLLDQIKNLKRIFTETQLNELSEIN